jgi:hypothetical protein
MRTKRFGEQIPAYEVEVTVDGTPIGFNRIEHDMI